MGNEIYFQKLAPFAEKASARLNIPMSVILAQWSWESAFGESDLVKRSNNHAGIKYIPGVSIAKGKTGMYADYKDMTQFVDDYVRVMSLGYYAQVRSAVSVEDTVKALGNSPWAESKYAEGSGVPGANLLRRITEYKLTTYDKAGTPTGNLDFGSISNRVQVMSQSDLIKYATIGLGVVIIAGLMGQK